MKYTKNKFADGQISVTINDYETRDNTIRERINTYEDLFFVRSIVEAYRAQMINAPLQLFIPCLLGQRSDRRFEMDQSFDLKIICDFINDCNFTRVKVFDPHSDVCLALINNSLKRTSLDRVKDTLTAIGTENIVLVSPDAGAYKKVFKYAEDLELPVVAANKYRAPDNSISLSFMGEVNDKNCLIVDDYCDGGRTFIELAKQLKAQGAAKVFLYVSHGLFSYGLDGLQEYVDRVFCTNSIKDIDHNFITQFKII